MDIIIIGGGAAGLSAAVSATKNKQNNVTLLEGNEKLGKKIFITGKGRCNVTNNLSKEDFFENIVRNAKFFYSAYDNFSNQDCVEFFEENGTKLKMERGGRYFPKSDKAYDITNALANASKGCKVILNCKVFDILREGEKFVIKSQRGDFVADKVIVCCGGISYKSTGSTGDGYKFAKKFGHKIIDCKPALAPIMLKDDCSQMAGLSLKNVTATILAKGQKPIKEFGEMLFMPHGVSGPIILTLCSKANRFDLEDAKLVIDLKPALSPKQLDDRIVRDFEKYCNKDFANSLDDLLPKSLINYIIERSGIDRNAKVNGILSNERKNLANLLKNLSFDIQKLADIDVAIVTSGGIDTKEINPKTMESKLQKGLFFAGESLDIDALTGGFNMQIAMSTGFLAGKD